MSGIVMKIARDPQFNFFITDHARLDKDSQQFQDILINNSIKKDLTSVDDLVEVLLKKTFKSGETIRIGEGKDETYKLTKEGKRLSPIVQNFLLSK
jgi:hypothetical protein